MDAKLEIGQSLPTAAGDNFTLRYGLLFCGILSSVFYVVMNIVVPMFAHGYSSMSQTVSELSAVGAETRNLWIALAIPYGCLGIAFGIGVWMSAGKQSLWKFVGLLLILNAIVGFFWPPMNPRGTPPTFTDTLHIIFTGVAVMIFVLQMILAAIALGRGFRIYSVISILVLVVFGALTSLEAPAMMLNQPTPMIGVWERIGIAAYIVWTAVLAVMLLKRSDLPE